jgi:hypothetical protein
VLRVFILELFKNLKFLNDFHIATIATIVRIAIAKTPTAAKNFRGLRLAQGAEFAPASLFSAVCL